MDARPGYSGSATFNLRFTSGARGIRKGENRVPFLERTLFEPGNDEFTVKVVQKPEEVKTLLETGFEYVCQKDGLIFLRKRK